MDARWAVAAIFGCALGGCADKPTYDLPDELTRGVVVPDGCTERDSPVASLALGDGVKAVRDGDSPFCSVELPGAGIRAQWAWLSQPAGDGDGGRPYVRLCLPSPDGDVTCASPIDAEVYATPGDPGTLSGAVRLEFFDRIYEGTFSADYECADSPPCG